MGVLQGFFFLLFGLGVVFWQGRRDAPLRRLLFVAYFLRGGVALLHIFVAPLPDSQADALTFERIAASWAAGGVEQWIAQFTSGPYFYSWILAGFYLLFGRSLLLAQGINVLAGTLVVLNIYRASSILWGHRHGMQAAWIATFFPLLVLYSAITLRESLMLLFFTWGLLGWIQWFRYPHWIGLLQAALGFLGATIMHTVMVWAVVLLFLSLILLCGFSLGLRGRLSRDLLAMGVLLGGTIALMVYTGWGLDKALSIVRGNLSPLEWIRTYLTGVARGRAVYLPNLIPHSWGEVLWMAPWRMLYFLFAPLWRVHEFRDILAFLVALIWLVLLIFWVRALLRIWPIPQTTRWLVVLVFFMWITLAFSVSNYGTAIRHTLKLLPSILISVPYPTVRWRLRFQNYSNVQRLSG